MAPVGDLQRQMATWSKRNQNSEQEMTYNHCQHRRTLVVGNGFLVARVGGSPNKRGEMNWELQQGLRSSEVKTISKNNSSPC